MTMDITDIGGAAAVGVPHIPAPRDADGDSEDEAELLTEPILPDQSGVSAAVQKSVVSGATVLYPKDHPAAVSGLQQDSEGRIIVPKGRNLSKNNLERPRDIAGQLSGTTLRESSEQKLNDLLEEELHPPETIARSSAGVPVIEVIFHTALGAIVSYYNKVVVNGLWLILIADNKAPAQAKFIPQPPAEGEPPAVFDMIVTGADKKQQKLRAMPLGVQFSVDDYDFVVMMLAEDEHGEEKRSGEAPDSMQSGIDSILRMP